MFTHFENMRRLLFTVAFLAVVCLSSSSVVKDRSKRDVTCAKPLPMTEYFEHGFDITEYDVYGCPEIGGKRDKFANFNTCEKGRKFTLRDEQKTDYDVPDAIFRTYYSPKSSFSPVQVQTQLREMKKTLMENSIFHFSEDSTFGEEIALFTNSDFYKEMRRIFSNGSKIALTYYKLSLYEVKAFVEHYSKKYWTKGFTSDAHSLPKKFEGNEKPYIDFLKKYGTHIMTGARFGGMVFRYASISPEEVRQNKEKVIRWEMQKDAWASTAAVDILCKKNEGIRHSTKVFAKNRHFTQVMIGGNVDASSYSNSSTSTISIRESPAILFSHVVPISSLFKENMDKQDNLKKALEIYMAKAFIISKVVYIKSLLESGHKLRDTTHSLLANAKESENSYNIQELRDIVKQLAVGVSE